MSKNKNYNKSNNIWLCSETGIPTTKKYCDSCKLKQTRNVCYLYDLGLDESYYDRLNVQMIGKEIARLEEEIKQISAKYVYKQKQQTIS